MRTLLVYDSVFGNTEKVAGAIANALGSGRDVAMVRVADVRKEQLEGIDLLVVGSPTRAFRPTPAVAKFLKELTEEGLRGVKATSFDTRIAPSAVKSGLLRFIISLAGYAAKPIAKRLARSGAELVAAPEGFFVEDSEGPLKAGELERAGGWARAIAGAAR
jgi:flavodoxin I